MNVTDLKTRYRQLLLGAALLMGSPYSTVLAQDACCGAPTTTYRIVNKVVYDETPVIVQKVQYETVLEEKQVTTSRPEWVTEMRTRRTTVAKPVIEREMREERTFVYKPVYKTHVEDRSYDETTYITETESREERVIVNRPVVETQMVQQQQVVRRPVQETVYQQQNYTTYQPVTTYRTQLVDQGGFVDSLNYQAGTTRNRLSWVPRGYAADQMSGQQFYHRGGFYWTPQTTPGTYTVNRAYVPNVVQQQVPVTSYMPQVVTQQVPYNVTRYQDEVVTQQVPVQVQKVEQVEEVRQVPVTVQRPVTKRIERQVEVQTVEWEKQEVVRQIPVTVQRVVTEEVEQEYPVQVLKMVTETKAVSVPVVTRKVVPVEMVKRTPRVITERIPLDAYYNEIPISGQTYRVERPVTAAPSSAAPSNKVTGTVRADGSVEFDANSVRKIEAAQKAAGSGSSVKSAPATGADAKPTLKGKDIAPLSGSSNSAQKPVTKDPAAEKPAVETPPMEKVEAAKPEEVPAPPAKTAEPAAAPAADQSSAEDKSASTEAKTGDVTPVTDTEREPIVAEAAPERPTSPPKAAGDGTTTAAKPSEGLNLGSAGK